MKRNCPRCEGRLVVLYRREQAGDAKSKGPPKRIFRSLDGIGLCETENALIDLETNQVIYRFSGK